MLVLTTAVACASPERTQENNNGSSQPPQPAQPLTAQNGTAPATDPSAPSIETPKPQAEAQQPAVKSDAPAKATNDLQASAAPGAKAPKLVVPTSTINFGKQPQDKKFIRAISIKNSGSADLHIESVAPS